MAFDYKKSAETILKQVGGEKNVYAISHCITRLRFILKDGSIPNDKEIEKIPGVIRVIRQGGQYQVVIGNEVSNVYGELLKLGSFEESTGGGQTGGSQESWFSRLCGFVAGCMTPLLPAMLGCGMIKVVLTLLTTFNLLDTAGSTYVILNSAGDSFFYFMPILLGYTTAKRLGSSPYLAMVMAAVMLHPDLTALLGAGEKVTYFGLPVTSATYSSSVLPILLMVPIMKYIELFADKICPNMVKVFLKPLIVIFISLPIALIVVGPIGVILGNYLADGVNFLYSRVGWLTIMLLSAAMPFIVMTGMHYALVPISTISLATLHFDAILVPTMFCSNLAQGGASLAVALKTKNKDIKSTAPAAGISAFIAGVTEPAMYGVTLKYKTPMIAAVIGAGFSGLYAGITGLVAYTMGGSPSFLSLIQMIGGDSFANMIHGVITLFISVSVSFIVCFILYKPDQESAETKDPAEPPASEIVAERKPLVKTIELPSPLSGTVIPLSEVDDPVFSGKILGEGVAIIPSEGRVSAPADGTISAVTETRHAVGLTTDSGVELLIHVGLDTVQLGGDGFVLHCAMGDKVKQGELLLEFDMDKITRAGYSLTTPVLVANMADFVSVKASGEKQLKAGDSLLTIV